MALPSLSLVLALALGSFINAKEDRDYPNLFYKTSLEKVEEDYFGMFGM